MGEPRGPSRSGGVPARPKLEPARVFAAAAGTELQGNAPEVAAKESYREFYNDVTRRSSEQSGMGAASFFP